MTPEEEKPEPEAEQWPDTLKFWVAITFAVLVVPSLLCAGAFSLLRRFF